MVQDGYDESHGTKYKKIPLKQFQAIIPTLKKEQKNQAVQFVTFNRLAAQTEVRHDWTPKKDTDQKPNLRRYLVVY